MILNKTSSEVYEEYRKLSDIEERCRKNNRGLNLINSIPRERYYVEVLLIQKINLKEKSEEISITTNLPIGNYWGSDVEEFLDDLKEFVEPPRYKNYITHNRRAENKVNSYGMPKFTTKIIKFKDIDFRIGILAFEKLKKDRVNIIFETKEILEKQRKVSATEEKEFNRYFLLREMIDDLGRQVEKEDKYSYCSYGNNDDKTIKILLDDDTFNQRLRKLEVELKGLNKKYPFLKLPSFYYRVKNEFKEGVEYEEVDDDDDEEN